MVRYAGYYCIEASIGCIRNPAGEGCVIDLAARHVNRLLENHKQAIASPVTPADSEDIRLSRTGDSEAYERLIGRYQEHVARIVWRFSRDRRIHEELIQDVFVEAYLSLGSFRGHAPFCHWLSRIATRIGYHFWKTQARERHLCRVSLQDWDMATQETMDAISANDAADLLHRLLAQLPPRDRLVLTLRYIEQCDVAETAQRTGWSKTMVKVQTLRAKRKLERLYFEREEETET
jgi:RNA polymerase sigma-70 factor (ECF subfamily)